MPDWIARELDSYFHDLVGRLQARGIDYAAMASFGGNADPEARMTDRRLDDATRVSAVADTLERIGERAARVLWWRFGQPMPRSLFRFGADPESGHVERGPTKSPWVRTHTPHGAGNLIHLTTVALFAHKRARTQRTIRGWCERLGQELQTGKATPDDRALVQPMRLACAELEHAARKEYAFWRDHAPQMRRCG